MYFLFEWIENFTIKRKNIHIVFTTFAMTDQTISGLFTNSNLEHGSGAALPGHFGAFCFEVVCSQTFNLYKWYQKAFLHSSTPTAGSSILYDHCYSSAESSVEGKSSTDTLSTTTSSPTLATDSFDTINDFYFSGKLKPLNSSRFIVDLHTLIKNMKCSVCTTIIFIEDAVGVLPSGVCGNIIVRCGQCCGLVRVAMGKTHPGKREYPTGP